MRKYFFPFVAALLLTPVICLAEVITTHNITVVEDDASTYSPTHIIDGDFHEEPWMYYCVTRNQVQNCHPTKNDKPDPPYTTKGLNQNTIDYSILNGINKGWNTSETHPWKSLFEWVTSSTSHNPNIGISNTNPCVEMNAESNSALYQDLHTYSKDVIRWTLQHAVRTTDGPETQSMRVDIGAPYVDGEGNIQAAYNSGDQVYENIVESTKATFTSTGCMGYNGYCIVDSVVNLSLSKSSQYSQWYRATGVYIIPEDQRVTRFAFVATQSTALSTGNLLDNITFSTLIGNLSGVHNANGDAIIFGYWGETDDNKKLDIIIGDKTYKVDMTSVEEKNFKITIPSGIIGTATSIDVYHQDYEAAKTTVPITNYRDVPTNQDPLNTNVYYTTFYHSQLNYALTNDNTTAYVATLDEGDNTLTLTKIAQGSQVIPKGTGVIFRKVDSAEPVRLYATANEGVTIPVTNSLEGVDNSKLLTEFEPEIPQSQCYVLSGKADDGSVVGVGFYKINTIMLKPHKAYVVINSINSNAPKRLRFVFNDTNTATDIEQTTNNQSPMTNKVLRDGQLIIIRDGVEYNAQGQLIK